MRKGHGSNGRNHVRPVHVDTRGGGGNRAGKREEHSGAVALPDGYLPNGRIRPTIAELRQHAELVRAIEPSAARRYIIDLALILGRDTREVAGWTYGDAHYIVRTTNERLEAQRRGTRR